MNVEQDIVLQETFVLLYKTFSDLSSLFWLKCLFLLIYIQLACQQSRSIKFHTQNHSNSLIKQVSFAVTLKLGHYQTSWGSELPPDPTCARLETEGSILLHLKPMTIPPFTSLSAGASLNDQEHIDDVAWHNIKKRSINYRNISHYVFHFQNTYRLYCAFFEVYISSYKDRYSNAAYL